MGDIAIRVDNLGKRYELGELVNAGRTLRAAGRALGFGSNDADDQTELWALRNVSFEVKRGEVLGVIGRNGAGKSTLLKILSRVTKPTEGYAELRGRVGSLLEVGTGFHPELTGRDNIYLNGAILGMKKREIDRRLDEIIDFSGVEKFLDTPVKRYSSGMYTRLAFAVAAHLDTEVLICDEVLAVGDSGFQRRCLSKMRDVANIGRTVLFVSHNMAAINTLCSRAIQIDGGSLVLEGEPQMVTHQYLRGDAPSSGEGRVHLKDWPSRYGIGGARILEGRLLDDSGNPATTFYRTNPMHVEFDFTCELEQRLHLTIVCVSESGDKILHLSNYDDPATRSVVGTRTQTVRITIPHLPLLAGRYAWNFAVHTDSLRALDVTTNVMPFTVEDIADTPRPYRSISEYGYCCIPTKWEIT